MNFKQDGAISLNRKPLELVDQIIQLVSNISSTESDANIRISKEQNTIDTLTTLIKLTAVSVELYGCTHLDLNKTIGEKAR